MEVFFRALDADDLALIERLRGKNVVAVINKTDLETKLNASVIESAFPNVVYISAREDAPPDPLSRAVARAVKTDSLDPSVPVLANERQRETTARAYTAVCDAAAAGGDKALDAVFAFLSEALSALGELSGENVTERVLDEVFSKFCVGK